MGVKFSELPILDPNDVRSDDYYAILDSSSGTLKRVAPQIPLPIDRGGTGNTDGYIRTGRLSSTLIGVKSTAEGEDTTSSGLASHAEGITAKATGDAAHAEGSNTNASNNAAHAEGSNTRASGVNSHAEGYDTAAKTMSSHAEGYRTIAQGTGAHSEGDSTIAKGNASHAGGKYTVANYECQTVIGKNNNNKANTLFEIGNGADSVNKSNAFEVYSNCSVVEGRNSCVGNNNHVGGSDSFVGTTDSTTLNSFAHGSSIQVKGSNSASFGSYTTSNYDNQLVCGVANGNKSNTLFEVGNGSARGEHKNVFEVYGNGSMSQDNGASKFRFTRSGGVDGYFNTEGVFRKLTSFDDPVPIEHGGTGNTVGYIQTGRKVNSTIGDNATAEGMDNEVSLNFAHGEGYGNVAAGWATHSEGYQNQAHGDYSHVEGRENIIGTSGSRSDGSYSHAEGYQNNVTGKYSHVEGYKCSVNGNYGAHAEGMYTEAADNSSHAEGSYTKALKENSHAEGDHTIANGVDSHVGGYQCETTGLDSFVHGIGITVNQDCAAVFGNNSTKKFSNTTYTDLICSGHAYGVSFTNETCYSEQSYEAKYGCCGTLSNGQSSNYIDLINLESGGVYMLYTTTYYGGPDSASQPLGKVMSQYIHMISVGIHSQDGLVSEVMHTGSGGTVSATLNLTTLQIKLTSGVTGAYVGLNFSLIRIN